MDLLERFDKIRPAGRDTYSCCCPAHNDKSPSLTIRHCADGTWLFHCFAGCQTFDILQAVGLRWGDLFPDKKYESSTSDYARDLWSAAVEDCVATHPYAQKKKITCDFGARRGTASGRVIGRDQDCIIVPMRSWDGDLVGVECINWSGEKQTFGSKGQLTLGYPEAAEYVHVTEGWASLWAVSQLRPKAFAGVVAFGKKLHQKALEISNRYPGEPVVHTEGSDNQDVWDHWNAGHGENYFGGKCL